MPRSSDFHRLEIVKLVGKGRALAHHDDATWMVSGGLPGESVEVRETGRRAGIVEGEAVEIVGEHHAARVLDPCPAAVECGGCDWPHVHHLEGAGLKAAAAAEAARTHPDLCRRIRQARVVSSDLAYRLRARLHWDPERAILGFYSRRSWRVVAVDSCRLLSPHLMRALPVLADSLARRCTQPVDVEWLEDLEGERAVAALRPGRGGPRKLSPKLVPRSDEVAEAVNGFHLLDTRGRLRHVWGDTTVQMNLPITLEVPVGAFFQGNRHLVPWLFGHVAELVGAESLPTWDLHAGVGLLAAAARFAGDRDLVLTEPFTRAADAAARNLPGAVVESGATAEAYLERHRHLPRQALALTDPPRAGMTKVLRRRLAEWNPLRVVMLACDPATWARDAAFLLGRGYSLAHLELIDLFPSTHHVEILAVLERD